MKKISLICFGKLKTPGMEAAVSEFTKRIGRYTDFKTFELKSNPIIEKESQKLFDLLESPSFKNQAGKAAKLWCLDESGKAMRTTEWAQQFLEMTDRGSGELIIIIGGSLGLEERMLSLAHQKISFGPQTLSHELARLVLVEQLYRVLSFQEGHPYHHEG